MVQDMWREVQQLLKLAVPHLGYDLSKRIRNVSDPSTAVDEPVAEALNSSVATEDADRDCPAPQASSGLGLGVDVAGHLCVDCGAESPDWASISFGTLFCMDCAGKHRGLGVHVSFVRSVSMDTWTEQQRRRMSLGGNDSFLEFMSGYPALQTASFATRYNSKAAAFYLGSLDAKCAGREVAAAPPSADAAHLPHSAHDRSAAASAVPHISDAQQDLCDQWSELEQVYLRCQHRIQGLLTARPALLESVSQKS
jgi:hypothetical protein